MDVTDRNLRRGWIGGVVALGLLVGACNGDDDPTSGDEAGTLEDDASDESTLVPDASAPADPCVPATHGDDVSQEPTTGGLDIPEVSGACPIPIPSLGLGIAIPIGWEATLLTEEALGQVADARLVRPAFLASARAWAADGAVFYAAGVSDTGGVSDLKVYVEDGADTTPEGLAARAQALLDSGQVMDASIEGDPMSGRVRVDFTLPLPAADDSEQTIDGQGSELLVADGDRLWRFIVTSESPEAQDELLRVFDTSLTFS